MRADNSRRIQDLENTVASLKRDLAQLRALQSQPSNVRQTRPASFKPSTSATSHSYHEGKIVNHNGSTPLDTTRVNRSYKVNQNEYPYWFESMYHSNIGLNVSGLTQQNIMTPPHQDHELYRLYYTTIGTGWFETVSLLCSHTWNAYGVQTHIKNIRNQAGGTIDPGVYLCKAYFGFNVERREASGSPHFGSFRDYMQGNVTCTPVCTNGVIYTQANKAFYLPSYSSYNVTQDFDHVGITVPFIWQANVGSVLSFTIAFYNLKFKSIGSTDMGVCEIVELGRQRKLTGLTGNWNVEDPNVGANNIYYNPANITVTADESTSTIDTTAIPE